METPLISSVTNTRTNKRKWEYDLIELFDFSPIIYRNLMRNLLKYGLKILFLHIPGRIYILLNN